MSTLAIDLGTKTGWATDGDSGTEILATEKELAEQRKLGNERFLDLRFLRLLAFVKDQIRAGARRIVFEDVQFASTQMQAQLWSSLRAAIWAAAAPFQARPGLDESGQVQAVCVPVGTLKKFASGTGAAQKEDMAAALLASCPAYADRAMDDNEIDAIWLLKFAEAVDAGQETWTGPYARKKAAKAAKREKAKAKRAAAPSARRIQLR